MARRRNLDTAARPGPRYEGEATVVHGTFDPELSPEGLKEKKYRKAKQNLPDTRRALAWRSQNGPE